MSKPVLRQRSTVRALSLLLVAGFFLGAAVEAETTIFDSKLQPAQQVNLWVKGAPLSMLVVQLAQLFGREASLGDGLDMIVSGRLNGNLMQALATLATDYPVLFDFDDDRLFAVGSDSGNSKAIAVASDGWSDPFKSELFAQIAPGNDVEIRSGAIRVSGHPNFVERTAGLVIDMLGSRRGGRSSNNKSNSVITDGRDVAAEPTGAVKVATSTYRTVNIQSLSPETGTEFAGAGSLEPISDIVEQEQLPVEQADRYKLIRWVTEIPGYDTF